MLVPPPPLLFAATAYPDKVALRCGSRDHTYGELLDAAMRGAVRLLAGRADLEGARVTFLTPRDASYVQTQWAVWLAGGVAVPLAESHPHRELAYVAADSEAEVLVAHPDLLDRLGGVAEERGLELLSTSELFAGDGSLQTDLPSVHPDRPAMIIYTSGTTGSPKGVVSTHAGIGAQVGALLEAWEWSPEDRIALLLPLHHVHGIVNVLTCALWSGATCHMLPRFDADAVWDLVEADELTLLMGVPTLYAKLAAAWEGYDVPRQERLTAAAQRLRLMVSGSAALPVQTLERWRSITGHTLLERYGMTELGMALSNPLHGERRPGFVGQPLPRVEARLRDADGQEPAPGESGEIQVRGPAVFAGYWRRPEATAEAFMDGWFKTGDIAVIEDGAWRILGRSSVDIIKTGGYKVSALEIEAALRDHPAIADLAVVGLPDDEWGERVAALVVLRPGGQLEREALRAWAREELAPYKVPTVVQFAPDLPRNALGKVVKPRVREVLG